MLKAKITVAGQLGDGTKLLRLACAPREALRIEVSFAGPIDLAWNWLAIHLRGRLFEWHKWRHWRQWPWRLSLGVLVGALALVTSAWFIVYAQLRQGELFAETHPPPAHECTAQKPCPFQPHSHRELHASFADLWHEITDTPEFNSLPFWTRSAAIFVGIPLLLLFAVAGIAGRRGVCDIYLIVLKPHEPFPIIDRDISRRCPELVFAVRTLGENVRRTFFSQLNDERLRKSAAHTSTLHITHPHFFHIKPVPPFIRPESYWALVRFAVSSLLPSGEGMRALAFTLRLHQIMMCAYVVLLALAIVAPALGWAGHAATNHFSLILAGLAVAWAAAFLVVHHGKFAHLVEWERLTCELPFRGCPIYQYEEGASGSDSWVERHDEEFEEHIRNFGLGHSKFMDLLLLVALLGYLEILHLIH